MPTSQTSFLSEIISGEPIPANKLGYFRARLINKLHELIISEFDRLSKSGEISKADLARRIGKKPEQITRWLGAPGNWTIETVSDLAIGMGCEPKISLSSFVQQQAALRPIETAPKGTVTYIRKLEAGAALAAQPPESEYSEAKLSGSALSTSYTPSQRKNASGLSQ